MPGCGAGRGVACSRFWLEPNNDEGLSDVDVVECSVAIPSAAALADSAACGIGAVEDSTAVSAVAAAWRSASWDAKASLSTGTESLANRFCSCLDSVERTFDGRMSGRTERVRVVLVEIALGVASARTNALRRQCLHNVSRDQESHARVYKHGQCVLSISHCGGDGTEHCRAMKSRSAMNFLGGYGDHVTNYAMSAKSKPASERNTV